MVEALPQDVGRRRVGGGAPEDEVPAVRERSNDGGGGGGGVRRRRRGVGNKGGGGGPCDGLLGDDDHEVAVVGGDGELRRGRVVDGDRAIPVRDPHRGDDAARDSVEPCTQVPRRSSAAAAAGLEEAERVVAVAGDEPVVAGE